MGKKKAHNNGGGKKSNPPPSNNNTSTNKPKAATVASSEQKSGGPGFVFGAPSTKNNQPIFDFSVGKSITPNFNFNSGSSGGSGRINVPSYESEDDDDDEYTDDDEYDEDEDYEEVYMKKILLQQLMMQQLGITPKVCPCCGEEAHEDDDDDDDDEYTDDDDYEDDYDEDDEDDYEENIYNGDNSPFGRVFDLITKQLKEKKIQAKKSKQIKTRGVVIEDITESEEARKKNDFLQSDMVEGFFDTMKDDALKSVITLTSVQLSNDSCSLENSIFYRTMMNALRPLLADVRKFIYIQGLRRSSNNPKLNIRPSTPGLLQYVSHYDIHPSREYMEFVVEKAFVPKSQQPPSEYISNRQDVIHSAKATINSKKEKKLHLEKSGKPVDLFQFDVNNFKTDTDNDSYDIDPTDPETKGITDEVELERMREYKTEGARIKRIRIGNWSPNLNYDGQFRIKVDPYRQCFSYTFFTYSPLYHNNFQSEEERMLYFPILKSALTENGLRGLMFREFERLKTSLVLSMEIYFKQITRIHFQKCNVDPKVMSKPLALLVLEMDKAPLFLTRRVSCDDPARNQWVQRSDFTTNKQASTFLRHYIMGDERELSRILAIMILSDGSRNIYNLYNSGMTSITMKSIPCYDLQKLTIKDKNMASLLVKMNLAKPNGSSASLNVDVYEKLCLKKALFRLNIFTLTKLLTLNVGQLLEDVNLSVPGLSKQELDNLQVYQVLFNEKFEAAGIYFSFCKARFYKESEYGHSVTKADCCPLNTGGARLASFNPKLPVKPSLNRQTNPFYTEDDKLKDESRCESYNELSSPFFFEDMKSVKFYKP